MRFIDDPVYWGQQYRAFLAEHADRLPPGVATFALHDWYYNPQEHRCPHDSWLEELSIIEPWAGNRNEQRSVEVRLRLLGAYHDGHIFFRYLDVRSYSLETPANFEPSPLHEGHGDFLVDEIRPLPDGSVEHAIKFSTGSRFRIECSNIEFEFKSIL